MKTRFALVVVFFPATLACADEFDPDALALFESKIRPVLVEHCYRCHSAEAEEAGKLKGALLVDSREGLLLGGASGPAVVPGDVDESLLIDALRYDFLQMPPEGKLPDSVIADFEAWVGRGAADPRSGGEPVARGAGIDLEAGRQHWAYQPPQRSDPPEVRDRAWPLNPIDRFVLARMEREGIEPVADADPATLFRRLSFDLTGLPPDPDALREFVADPSPAAYARLVDRLLASPQFGERWGRHWLDVARFGESLTLRGLVFREAWRYRDFVVDALNEDMPFDQFVREQIAGDLLPAETIADARRQRIATTFLVLGNSNLEEQDKEQLRMDIVDEQIETIGQALLAQTISCARCHDHKFDPIPTGDYYALAGILSNTKAVNHANVSAWIEVPLPMEAGREAAIREHEEAIFALEQRITSLRDQMTPRGGILAEQDVQGIVIDDTRAGRVGEWVESTYSGTYIGSGYLHDDNGGKGEKTLTFQVAIPEAGRFEVRLAYSHGGSRASSVPLTILSADGDSEHRVDMRKPPPIDGRFVSLGEFRFEANAQGYVQISNEGTDGHVTADAVVLLPLSRRGASDRDPSQSASDDSTALAALEDELQRLKRDAPPRDLAMSVVEEETIANQRIHIRGSVHNLGAEVPRGFLQVATPGRPPTLPEEESGRRELADWLVSPENPLTARVVVNRVWHWLLGEGIVRTIDNFGNTGEPPTHPELLDSLAVQLVEQGWSIKELVREIVTSRTYRLASSIESSAEQVDPENRLRWRMDRRRLEAECLRDAMLAISGHLDLSMGGRGFPADLASDYGFESGDTRRSLYSPVFRNALPDVFEAFDFADPSMVVGRRDASTVAPQALFMLNHPFVMHHARETAKRLLAEEASSPEQRVDAAYRLVLGRDPTDRERDITQDFLGRADSDPEQSWTLLIQALFGSFEFRHLN